MSEKKPAQRYQYATILSYVFHAVPLVFVIGSLIMGAESEPGAFAVFLLAIPAHVSAVWFGIYVDQAKHNAMQTELLIRLLKR